MERPKSQPLDLNREFAKIPLHEIADRLGISLPPAKGSELRLPCFFCESDEKSSYGQLAINLEHPANLFQAHCCGVSGNRFTLMYFWKHGELPPGRVIRGDDYKEMLALHREFTGDTQVSVKSGIAESQKETKQEIADVLENIPLKCAEKEAARQLEDLFAEFIADPQQMKPAAAKFIRSRPWMTEEVLKHWKVGWIPGDGRSMFRRNFLVYAHSDADGNILSYSGRDLHFEQKQKKWQKSSGDRDSPPAKHKFVKGFHRGLELYGEHEILRPERKEALENFSLVIVEGMNDAIRLNAAEFPAVALCSNRATDRQIEKIAELAKQFSEGKIRLLPDRNKEGKEGFSEILWKLQSIDGIVARPGWPEELENVAEPENLSDEQCSEILAPFLLRRS